MAGPGYADFSAATGGGPGGSDFVAAHNQVNYMEGLLLKSQQMDAQLMDVTMPVEIDGTVSHKDSLGLASLTQRTSRFQANTLKETPRYRRNVIRLDYEHTEVYDRNDYLNARRQIQAESEQSQNVAYAFNRQRTNAILNAMTATATAEENGATVNKAFDSANQRIDYNFEGAGARSGLTINKLLEAQNIFSDNNVDGVTLHLALSQRQINQILVDKDDNRMAYGYDWNTLRPLAGNGTSSVDFMGMTWHKVNLITDSIMPSTAAGTPLQGRSAYMFTDRAIGYGETSLQVYMDLLDGNGHGFQVAHYLELGATRLWEEEVVQIECQTTNVVQS